MTQGSIGARNARHAFRVQQNKKARIKEPAFITQNQVKRTDSYSELELTIPESSLQPRIEHIQRSTTGMNHLSDEWVKLFMARQKDLKLAKNLELQFARFSNIVCEQKPEKPVLREQGFGLHSAKVLSRILRDDTTIISLDLSMNNLTLGLEHLIEGLHNNSTIVTLRLKNNNIDGRKSQK